MSDEKLDSIDISTNKSLLGDTKICSICLLIGSTDDSDPIVYCDRCGIIVHESCYNADALDEKSSDSSSPSEYWFCTPCLAQVDDPICALCPSQDRCQPFWPTLESTWIHSVCALAVPSVLFYDELYYTPVDISNVPAQKFGNKICQFCQLRSGVTVPCDAGLCPNSFHISCANKQGLLQIRGELSKIECELYCLTHQSSKDQCKRIQANFSVCEVQQKQLDSRTKLYKETQQALIEHLETFKKRSALFPKLPKPKKSHLSRSLMCDTVALKEFFAKADRLRSSELDPTINKTFDLSSPENNPLVSFVNNENDLVELRRTLKEKQDQLNAPDDDDLSKQELDQLEKELKQEYRTLDELNDRYRRLIDVLKVYEVTLNMPDENQSSPTTTCPSEMCRCSVCRQTDRSDSMIKCCQCQQFYHGDCLKPAMPKKTLLAIVSAKKKYEWQCAGCVNVQQEQLDQVHVDVKQPRQTRPRKTNELVLRESLIKFGSRKRKDSAEQSTSQKRKVELSPTESNESSSRQKRTSLIEKLFTRKSKETFPQLSLTRKSSNKTKRLSTNGQKRNSRRKTTKRDDSEETKTPTSTDKVDSSPSAGSSNKREIRSSSDSLSAAELSRKENPLSVFDFSEEEQTCQTAGLDLHSAEKQTIKRKSLSKIKSK